MQGEILRRWPEDFSFCALPCTARRWGVGWGSALPRIARDLRRSAEQGSWPRPGEEPADTSQSPAARRRAHARRTRMEPLRAGTRACGPAAGWSAACRRTRASRLCRACMEVGLAATAGAHRAAKQGAEKIRRAAHAPEETTGEGCGRSDGRRGAGPQLVLPGAPALFAAGSSAEALSGLLWPEGAQEGMPRSMAVPSS